MSHERSIDLGNIELGGWVKPRTWLNNLSRYKSVRFFGFVRGRFFLGIVWGGKGQSKLDQYSEEITRLSDENIELRDELRVKGEQKWTR